MVVIGNLDKKQDTVFDNRVLDAILENGYNDMNKSKFFLEIQPDQYGMPCGTGPAICADERSISWQRESRLRGSTPGP
jgi:hypothetical protein